MFVQGHSNEERVIKV